MGLMEKLDKKFGRLSRTRLDSVINVIDTDSVLHRVQSDQHRNLHNVEVNIRCADVVLLNKIDLVDESGIDQVRQWVENIQPGIAIYQTERCYLGLDRIMDV